MTKLSPRTRIAFVLAAASLGCGALASPAQALDATQARQMADRIADAWRPTRIARGSSYDGLRRPTRGYGYALVGYAMLRAAARKDDEQLAAAGVRAIDATLDETPRRRGVFDLLAASLVYNFSRRELGADPAFQRSMARWREYLRSTGDPILGPKVEACSLDSRCFHNHEIVEAAADLEALATGLASPARRAKLGNRGALRARALRFVGRFVPRFTGRGARSSGPGPRSGMGILADSQSFPLTYHALSVAMLARALDLLGDEAPKTGLLALRRAIESSAAFMAPDGDLGIVGSRQEQSWVLAATAYAGEVAARLAAPDRAAVRRFDTLAERALQRLRTVHGYGIAGINQVPRLRFSANTLGIDSRSDSSSGLTAMFLNLAADASDRLPELEPTPLTADSDGFYLDPDQTGFATVRHGDLWYLVKQHPRFTDLRFDFGLMALKQRGEDGRWRDLMRLRPHDRGKHSAGPVLLFEGRRYLPWGKRIEVKPGGVVEVHGGFRGKQGGWLRRGVRFRFAPVEGGVAMSFPVRAGDLVRLITYLPAATAHQSGPASVADRDSEATLSLPPKRIDLVSGYASCCNASLVAAAMLLRAERDGEVTYTLRSRAADLQPEAPAPPQPPASSS